MSFKLIIQFGIASVLLVLSTGATWYEGSALLENTREWKYSAIFSRMKNGQVENVNDILSIDYFVYAVKFAPTFPFIMLLSGTYLIILIGYMLLKRNGKMFTFYQAFIGVLFLVLSGFVSNSPTIGLKIFFVSFLVIGILSIIMAIGVTRFTVKSIKV